MLSRGSVKHVTVTLVEGFTCLNVRLSAKVSVCYERCRNWIQRNHGGSVARFVCFWRTLHNGIVKVSEEVSNI